MKAIVCSIILVTSFLMGCMSPTSIKGLKEARKTGEPIFIDNVALQSSNFAPVRIYWINPGPKTIWKVIFFVSTFDQNGEKIFSTQLETAGPHPSIDEITEGSKVNRVWWLEKWYRESMSCILIDKIEIFFMDDTKTIIDTKDQLDKLIADDVVKECGAKEKDKMTNRIFSSKFYTT